MFLLLVLGMLEALVVLVEGIFERVKSPNFFVGEIVKSKMKMVGVKQNLKIPNQSQKSTFTLEYYIALFPLHYWFKSYGSCAELVDFAYWWSCIRKGQHLQPAFLKHLITPIYKNQYNEI